MMILKHIISLSSRMPGMVNMKRFAAMRNIHPDTRRSILLLESQALSYSRKASNNTRRMVDPKHVVSYEDILKVINQPQKVIIDVRNPTEVNSTGKIPSSINIPLPSMQEVLTTMSDEDFKRQYHRKKPSPKDEIIFYCQSGRRSTEALDKALKLGYSNSKTYLGSWNDWSSKHQMK